MTGRGHGRQVPGRWPGEVKRPVGVGVPERSEELDMRRRPGDRETEVGQVNGNPEAAGFEAGAADFAMPDPPLEALDG